MVDLQYLWDNEGELMTPMILWFDRMMWYTESKVRKIRSNLHKCTRLRWCRGPAGETSSACFVGIKVKHHSWILSVSAQCRCWPFALPSIHLGQIQIYPQLSKNSFESRSLQYSWRIRIQTSRENAMTTPMKPFRFLDLHARDARDFDLTNIRDKIYKMILCCINPSPEASYVYGRRPDILNTLFNLK